MPVLFQCNWPKAFFPFPLVTVLHVWPLEFILSSFTNSFLSPFLLMQAAAHISAHRTCFVRLGRRHTASGQSASFQKVKQCWTNLYFKRTLKNQSCDCYPKQASYLPVFQQKTPRNVCKIPASLLSCTPQWSHNQIPKACNGRTTRIQQHTQHKGDWRVIILSQAESSLGSSV